MEILILNPILICRYINIESSIIITRVLLLKHKVIRILLLIVNYAIKGFNQVNKGVRRMPWHLKAMKDVVSCDKLR